MLKQYIQGLIELIVISTVFVCVAAVIWYLRKDSGSSFQDILFWVAVAPIVFFSLGQIRGDSSESDPSFQISKSLINQPPVADSISKNSGSRFDLKMITAGAIVLAFSMIF